MIRIVGIPVTLFERTQSGEDAFGAPIWTETPVRVDNVLVGQPTTEEITQATQLYGKRLSCWLGIPKGDGHSWEDRQVEWTDAYGRTIRLRTFGIPVTGIEANVPGPWHMKVRAEVIRG